MLEDTLIFFGDAVKVLDDNGRIGALGIRFSDGKKKDLAGEYFTAKTYLGPKDGDGQECTFDHGFPLKADLEEYADHTFAPVKARREKLGIWVETVLNLADEYEKAVFNFAKKGRLGWSSGSAGHRVKKDEKTGEIKSWPVAEWALTPRPCEPQNYGTALPLKSLGGVKFVDLDSEPDEQPPAKVEPAKLATKFGERINQLIADREEDGQEREVVVKALASSALLRPDQVELIITENQRPSNAVIKAFARTFNIEYDLLKDLADRGTPKTIKGMFEEDLAGRVPSVWELHSTLCSVVKKIAEAAESSAKVGRDYDWQKDVATAVKEYGTRLADTAKSQVEAYVSGGGPEEEFYLKTAMIIDGSLVSGDSLDFDEHSELVVTANAEIVKRFRNNHEMRVKAGRVLSEKNRNRLVKLVEQMMTAVTECQNLLEETKPMASETEKNAAWIHHQRVKHELQRAQIGV